MKPRVAYSFFVMLWISLFISKLSLLVFAQGEGPATAVPRKG